jgi:HD-GYP domain-containing protein (c-di-GMP phosphodiesterase class II)
MINTSCQNVVLPSIFTGPIQGFKIEERTPYMTASTTSNNRIQDSNVKLQKVMEDAIRVMAALIEKRDPYTSHHQLRVAELASAIATEMHFSEDRVLGVNLASAIHDIGKILIPFDILSRPGKLNHIEFEMVKEHPKFAHDILGNMEFCWPITQIIYQHHERLDGSGYPGGLKGEAILPEARLLAVADVIEAMSFDRPYRPALGIALALEEINMKRGILYDVDVVDACVRLFKEKGFGFG